ncbi:MAG: CcoQ/FixQ family Cbb3-type cytochrome c oxidase assembly chaperone [Rhodobacteraceae bacterium]|jgi:cytochrome c oxidase cbb3-type subunit 4|uniref:Cytochrome c oxidase cbb3-type subunit 4 n=1 Tax=Salipiger profundus TaxID=1229727 RepID=A0A1U7D5X8_9RHOB|nr:MULTISPECIES: cbb3-type cytochrome c oxidase subunit 3 [Salipiger]APX23508.1 cytochrome c oxidase cbb3-type subunit 4 [Salipiger profundus]MAB08723.1 CcoQ/FixQ family Cbb3-type cytochrome c oxidase assembly chaperone [Paracoccaceae bacterium]GGA20751.1 cytochrome oxidase [Salipiger profundus]SFC79663.1 cytochrome c oxidase cbb3-type subunit 4 [Salipiger profundus]
MGHETYNALRHFADSWGLLAMFVFFVGVIVWALRPGSRKKHADAANVLFRNEDKPATAASDHRARH